MAADINSGPDSLTHTDRDGMPQNVSTAALKNTRLAKLKAKSVPDFFKRVSAWGDKQIARIIAGGGKHAQSKAELINDQVQTLTAVAEGCKNVEEIIARITNMFEDSDSARRPAVVCSSVHKAKGLEWGKVVLVAASFKNKNKSQEEANIYYVAVTRSKRTLILAE